MVNFIWQAPSAAEGIEGKTESVASSKRLLTVLYHNHLQGFIIGLNSFIAPDVLGPKLLNSYGDKIVIESAEGEMGMGIT